MKKLFYPAIFHFAEEGGFWISFPDFMSANLNFSQILQEALKEHLNLN